MLDEKGDMVGTCDEIMGILCHLDVVPEGKDWDYEPFGGQVAEGRIYGRGAIAIRGHSRRLLRYESVEGRRRRSGKEGPPDSGT